MKPANSIFSKTGVTAIPMSAFYQDADIDHFARFCFSKNDAVLTEACERLKRYFTS